MTFTRPDGTQVVYLPFAPGPGGIVPDPGSVGGLTFTQTVPSATWTINHNLVDPSVTVIVDGEAVSADVAYLGPGLLTVSFGAPVTGEARLT